MSTSSAPRPGSVPGAVLAVLAALALAAGCTQSASLAREDDLARDEVRVAEAVFSSPPVEPVFVERSRGGAAGGELTFVVSGDPDEVLAMLLDFPAQTGARPWAEEYETVEHDAERVVARWVFRGKLGVHPTARIEFRPESDGDARRLAFRVVEGALGLRTFDGAIRLVPLDGGRTLVRELVRIDSGLPFVNASVADVEAGLRADAAFMRERMLELLAAG